MAEAKKGTRKPVLRKVCTRADGVNLRAEPSAKAPVLAVLMDGAIVEVNKTKPAPDGWAAIKAEGACGYVLTKCLN